MLENSPVNNMAFAFDYPKAIDILLFKQAFANLVTTFDAFSMHVQDRAGSPVMVIRSNHPVQLEEVDLSAANAVEERLDNWLQARCARPTDIGESLYDAALLCLAPKHWVFYLKQHHLITDGWSMSVQMSWLQEEYSRLLSGEPSSKGRPSPEAYSDYLNQFAELSKSGKGERARGYWADLAEKLPPRPRLFGRGNPDLRPESYRTVHQFSRKTTEELMALLREPDVRNFSDDLAMLTVFATVLFAYTHRISGEKAFAIGMPFHNRLTAADRQTAGVFMEIFPVYLEMEGDETFGELLAKVKIAVMDYLRNVHPGSSAPATAHKCNVYFNLINKSFGLSAEDQVTSRWLHNGHTEPSHHLVVKLYDFDDSGKLKLSFDLNNEIFLPEVREQVPMQFLQTLELFMSDRSLPITTNHPATTTLLDSFNISDVISPIDETIVSLFRKQVLLRGGSTAMTFNGMHLSFEMLDRRSNQVANFLLARGLQAEDLVAVCGDRSFEQVIMLLGVMKAGGAYLPIDSDYPAERIDYLLQDSGVTTVLCQDKYVGLFTMLAIGQVLGWQAIASQLSLAPASAPAYTVSPSDLIYVYYTSGSTGRPKGVLVQHDGVLNMLLAMQQQFQLDPEKDVTLYKTVLSFDSAVFEIFWPLIVGSRFVLLSSEHQANSRFQQELIQQEGITTIYFVASLLEVYLEEAGEIPGVRQIYSGGEELKPETLSRLRELHPDADLYNFYGPTEGSIGCSIYQVPAGEIELREVPIGKPVSNAPIYLLDPTGNCCPVGVPGELCIGGIHTARGYHQRPELTAEKFVVLPLGPDRKPERVYRTGDLARWLPDGNLVFMGRVDSQVKIRGVRVEPGEVTSVLLEFSEINGAMVIADDDPEGRKRLVAYVIPGSGYDRTRLRDSLTIKLPSYLLPSALIELDEFPRLLNGKIDRKAFPLPETVKTEEGVNEEWSDFEETLRGIWLEVMGRPTIGRKDHFLDLGGESLMSIRIVTRVNDVFHLSLSANVVFRYPTIERLATHIETVIRQLLEEMNDE